MRADLHVHSRFSTRPTVWVLQKIGCPESFTDPERVYAEARSRGMDLVTITDHNSIEGALTIADRPGAFVSDEITAYFPEDRCKVHVLAYDLDEHQHAEIQRLRENIYELVPWLRRQNIAHALAHPLFSINHRLTAARVEQLLLLFDVFELNGTRERADNLLVRRLLDSLTPELIGRLADRHGIEPASPDPWRKGLIAGSDDHSGLNIACRWTEVAGASDVASFLQGVRRRESRPAGADATPKVQGRNFYSIAWRFYKSRFGLDRHVGASPLLEFVDRTLAGDTARDPSVVSRVVQAWRQRRRARSDKPSEGRARMVREAEELVVRNEDLLRIARGRTGSEVDLNETLFTFVNDATNRIATHFVRSVVDQLGRGNVFSLFDTIGSAGAMYSMLAPYFVAYSVFAQDRRNGWEIERHFPGDAAEASPRDIRVAYFTDTLDDANGVATAVRENSELAARTGKDLTVVTCREDRPRQDRPGVTVFPAVDAQPLPAHPEQSLAIPPFLELLAWVYDQGFTHLHVATPGPVGLAALGIARVLDLPIAGTYYTHLPKYVGALTGETSLEELAWRGVTWFHDQLDAVYCATGSTRDELIERGLRPERVVICPHTLRLHAEGGSAPGAFEEMWELWRQQPRRQRRTAPAGDPIQAYAQGPLSGVPGGVR